MENLTYCKIGLATYKHQLFEILVKVMDIEKIDYIKINFSEVFGDNSENWAWYTVKNEYQDILFYTLPNIESDKSSIINFVKVF